jgi:hypothetical protein
MWVRTRHIKSIHLRQLVGVRAFVGVLGRGIEVNVGEWLRGVDLNHRLQGYEPCELPGCSTPRQYM